MDLEQFLRTVNLNESTRAILEETQQRTGKPFLFIHDPELPVQAFVKIARASMDRHIITYSGTDPNLLNHHIAHECATSSDITRPPKARCRYQTGNKPSCDHGH